MTRVRVMVVGVTALVLVLAGLLAWRLTGRPNDSSLSKNKKRQFLLVLANVSSGCKLVAIDGERAFRDETVTWRIVEACGYGNRGVRLVFTGSNSADFPYPGTGNEQLLEGRFNANHETYLRLKIKKFTGAAPACQPPDPDVPNDKCWAFPYDIQVQDGANPNLYTKVADPRLEVDP